MTMNDREKRRFPRIPIDLSINYRSAGVYMLTEGSNISSEGVFIKTKTLEPLGTVVDLEFVLDSEGQQEIVICKGEVIWARSQAIMLSDGRVCPPGVGIRFIKIGKKLKKLIEGKVKETVSITL